MVRLECSERSWLIPSDKFSDLVMQNWFLANTTHVVDLLFYLLGTVEVFSVNNRVGNKVDEKIITGLGNCLGDVPFVYSGAWCAPGGWVVQIYFDGSRADLMPLERLTITKINGENEITEEGENPAIKPGFMEMIDDFLQGREMLLPTFREVQEKLAIYRKMSG